MRTVFVIAMNDLRLMITERAAFIARLIIPIAFIVVVGIANDAFQTDGPETPVLGIYDSDGTTVSRFYEEYVRKNARNLEVVRVDQPAVEALDEGMLDYLVVIPDGFEASVAGGSQTQVELILAVSDPQQSLRLESLLQAANQRAETIGRAGTLAGTALRSGDPVAASAAARGRAAELLITDRIEIRRQTVELPNAYELVGFQQSVPGMGSMFVMLGVLAGASLLIEDRKRFTLQRTVVAPVSRLGFVLGKILGRFVFGLMQYLVAIATGLIIGMLFDIEFGSSPFLLLAVMAGFTFCVSAMSIFIAAVVERVQQARGLETLLAVTLAPLGGAWWSLDIEIIPEFMRQIAVISPFYWVMRGFKAAIFDLGLQAAVLPIAVLVGLGLVLAVIGSARLKFE